MTRLGPRTLFCVALSLATVAPLAAAAPSASQAVPRAPLHTYLTNADYPSEAIRNGEQGTVEFRLTVDLNGRVSDCAIQASSGSAVLDATSCRIMTERARFNPARDENGKPVPGPFESRISWRLPEDTANPVDLPPAVGAAMQIWSACTHGEAAKLVLSVVAAPEVATRSLAACARFEALADHLFLFIRTISSASASVIISVECVAMRMSGPRNRRSPTSCRCRSECR